MGWVLIKRRYDLVAKIKNSTKQTSFQICRVSNFNNLENTLKYENRQGYLDCDNVIDENAIYKKIQYNFIIISLNNYKIQYVKIINEKKKKIKLKEKND